MTLWLNWNKRDHPRYNYGDQGNGFMAQLEYDSTYISKIQLRGSRKWLHGSIGIKGIIQDTITGIKEMAAWLNWASRVSWEWLPE